MNFPPESRQLWATQTQPAAPRALLTPSPTAPAAAAPLAPGPSTCTGSRDPALGALDDFPRKLEGGKRCIEMLRG